MNGYRSISAVFEERASEAPEAEALICGEERIGFGDLDERSSRLAHHLLRLGARRGDRIGVCTERGIDLVIGLLGILKAGAAYLPLDPSLPRERIAYMRADAGAGIVLTDSLSRRALAGLELLEVRLDADRDLIATRPARRPGLEMSPDEIACITYTSGTTGLPKGVLVPHRAVPGFMLDVEYARWDRDSVTLQHSSMLWDAFTLELWTALLHGGRCVLLRDRVPTLDKIADAIREHGVNILWLTSSLFNLMIDSRPEALAAVPQLIIGGETLSVPHVLRALELLPDTRLVNGYGPVECTVFACCHVLPRAFGGRPRSIPIGQAIGDRRVHLLDRSGNRVPIGAVGEICVGGPAVAQGYANDAALTAAKMVPDPFSPDPGGRLYKTGDLARHRLDGTIEFVGRRDRQLKVRGYRVEPGEIEAALLEHPDITAAVVAPAGEEGEISLLAYLQSERDPRSLEAEVRALLVRLPEPMRPARLVTLRQLPRNANGKIDRGALPQPELLDTTAGSAAVAPRGAIEERLATVWAEVLGRPLGVTDNFFALGGSSLRAIELVDRIQRDLGANLELRDLFEAPTVAGLAERMGGMRSGGGEAPDLPCLAPGSGQEHEPFPLTDVQQAYWIGRSAGLEMGGVATHGYTELEGRGLDSERFAEAFNRVVARHPMLRAIVLPDGRQRVLERVPRYEPVVLDLRRADPRARETALAGLRSGLSHRSSAGETWPLFELRLTRVEDDLVRVHLSVDALMVDAWSSVLIGRDLARFYADPGAELSPVPVTFRDYVLARVAWEEGETFARARRYWRERLNDLPPAPALPLARSREAALRPRFTGRGFRLSPQEWSRLRERAAAAGLPLNAVLLAAFAEVLALWSESPRFTINLTLFDRLPVHAAIGEVVGDFTSLILLAVDASPQGAFADRARRLHRQLWEDLDHRHFGAIRVLRELSRAQEGRPVLMPVVFTSVLGLPVGGDQPEPAGTLGLSQVFRITQTPQVWIDHQVAERAGGLDLNWDVAEGVFPPGLIEEMFGTYRALVHRLTTSEETWDAPGRAIQLPAGQAILRAAVNATGAPWSQMLLHEPFEQRAREAPDRMAVLSGERSLSYGALDRHSRRLAGELRRLGAGSARIVAVVMEKGWEQVVAVLGVLRSGAAYLPVDPGLPGERLRFLIEHGEAAVVLTQPSLAGRLPWPPGVRVLSVVEEGGADAPVLAPPPAADDLAYVIFTSGSTGVPKGVMISHRGAVNTILEVNRRFGVTPADRVLALSSMSFDLSVWDIFGTLAAGGAIVLPAPEAARAPSLWLEVMRRHRVTVWNSVPGLLEMLVEELAGGRTPPPEGLRLVMLSGDWIPVSLPDRARALWREASVVSLGGATEASIWSIFYPVRAVDPSWSSIPYGRPLANQRLHVLHESMDPCPDWVPGRLFIAGDGLAIGYWRDEEKTRQSFLSDPATGERLYDTGDYGRYLPEGDIEILGRRDLQIKILGHRIELGEIETALQQHPSVRGAAVSAVGPDRGRRRLVAYIVSDSATEDGELRAFLRARLPDFMVPQQIVRLGELPRTVTGKVDRAALRPPAPSDDGPRCDGPRSADEALLLSLCADVLALPRLGVHDNFFESGGDSLLAIRYRSRIAERLGVEIPVDVFFQRTTVAALSEYLSAVRLARGEAVLEMALGPREEIEL